MSSGETAMGERATGERATKARPSGGASQTRPERGPLRQPTRDRVLDVAERLFARQGYAGTGLREIARDVGIREPSLYRHFDSKADLYGAVLERALQPVVVGLDAILTGSDARDPDQIADWILGEFARRPDLGKLLLYEVASADDHLDPVLRRALEPILRRSVRVMTTGSGDSLDGDEVALWLVAMFFVGAGYFASSPILELVGGGEPTDPAMLRRQRRLMSRLARALDDGPAASDGPDASMEGERSP